MRYADGLPRKTPESAGVSSQVVLDFLNETASAGQELHGFMLSRRGAVVAEGWWWPYASGRRHMCHSLTKSVTVTAVGLALEEGLFGIDDKVVSFFPDRTPINASEHLRSMSVRNLLTMQTGHARSTSGSLWRPITTSWIDEFFKIPVVVAPGTTYKYTSAASYMLSAIVTSTSGLPVAEYLGPRIFQPLGIVNFEWELSPDNVNPGGNGLSWTTADSLKLGMLHAQRGVWNGRRLLPQWWVDEATRYHTALPGYSISEQTGPDAGYGFQWWIGPGSSYFALGLFMQLVVVFPAHDAALAIFAASYESGPKALYPHIWRHFPAAFSSSTISVSAATEALSKRTSALRLLAPLIPTSAPAVGAVISGRAFVLAPNGSEHSTQSVLFDIGPASVRYQLTDKQGITHAIDAGFSEWLEQNTTMPGGPLHHMYEAAPDAPWAVVAGARWVDEVTLEMTWVFVQTAFRDTVTCHFQRASRTATHTVHILRRVNINSHRLPNHTSLEGVAEPALSWRSSPLVLISAWLTVALGLVAALLCALSWAMRKQSPRASERHSAELSESVSWQTEMAASSRTRASAPQAPITSSSDDQDL